VTTTKTRTRVSNQNAELQKKLLKRLIVLVGTLIVLFLAMTVFSPKIGFLFGLISVNRNQEDAQNDIKPNVPILAGVPESVKEEKLNLTGYAPSGATVKLYVNGPEAGSTIVGADGIFNFYDIHLNSGRNSIFAKVIDSQGKESDKSQTYVINVDKQEPKIEVESPEDGDTIRNLDKRIKVIGKVNEKATVKVNGSVAVVRPDLSFEFLMGVSPGDVEIKIEATDLAGNTNEEKLFVKYVQDN